MIRTRLNRQKKGYIQRFFEAIGGIIGIIIEIFIGFLLIILHQLWRFRQWEYRFFIFSYFIYNAYSALLGIAQAPYAQADGIDRVITTLPMKVHPDLKLRDTVLSLVAIEFGKDQVDSFNNIVLHESGWDPKALNPHGGACGLFQALPCSKVASSALQDQLQFGFNYIKSRYGTPNNAWKFWQQLHEIDGKMVHYY